jgi:hypothetical protein
MFYSLSTLLHVLAASAAASIPFVAAQTAETPLTTDQVYGNLVSTAAPVPGFNAEGTSVFTNFVNAFNNKQLFMIGTGSHVYERPGSEPFRGPGFLWCGDLTFSDFSNSSLMGYAGRCAGMALTEYAASGEATVPYSPGNFSFTDGISAIFVEQLNVFQGQYHSNTDDWVYRYWDSGLKTMPMIGWEGHDEGDMSANAATSSWSGFAGNVWMTVEEVAQLFNTSTDEFTPDKFKQIYEETWIKQHEFEEASDNPNAEAELEIIDEVKTEADSTDGGTVADDGSGSRRKLVSVAGRFVSAALRVFGI